MYKAEEKKGNGCFIFLIIVVILIFIDLLFGRSSKVEKVQPTPRLSPSTLGMADIPSKPSNLVDSIPKNVEQAGCPDGCTFHVVGCDIKGNISFNSREKIYHLPGQEYYTETVINSKYDERWFCTEEEAINNGWRKAYN